MALPCTQASKSQTSHKKARQFLISQSWGACPSLSKAWRDEESHLSVTFSFSLSRHEDPLCRKGALPHADAKGSPYTRESNPEPQQMLRASPLHLRGKANAKRVKETCGLKHVLSTSHSCSGARIDWLKGSSSPWWKEVQTKRNIWSSAHCPSLPAPNPLF